MPDLVLLDLMLPKIDGYEVFKRIRSDEKYKDMPVVMLTARSEFDDIKKGMTVGADGYITKPFDVETLLSIVKGCVGGDDNEE